MCIGSGAVLRRAIAAAGERRNACALACLGGLCVLAGCRSPQSYRDEADRVAYRIIEEAQREALGRTEAFTIETPADTLRRRLLLDQKLPHADASSLGSKELELIKQWPDDPYMAPDRVEPLPMPPFEAGQPLRLALLDALQVAARSSREYQAQKETVFQAALALDLERDAFRNSWVGAIEGLVTSDLGATVSTEGGGNADVTVSGASASATGGITRQLQSGATLAANLGMDLVKLLTQEEDSSLGLLADATVSIPLLRGSGKFVVTEPLTQAERSMVYAIYTFEEYKRDFAVRIASEYLTVLQAFDTEQNQRQNYESQIRTTRWTQSQAKAGLRTEIEVDQARQTQLQARNAWVTSRANIERRLNAFKILLGLPTDAQVELDREELARLAARGQELIDAQVNAVAAQSEQEVPPASAPVELRLPSNEGAGLYEFEQADAIELGLKERLDLRVSIGRVLDEQRGVAVAADQLRADLRLLGSGSTGEARSIGAAGQPDAKLEPGDGQYSATATLDLPWERTLERNQYRNSLITLEAAVRAAQQLEDQIKLDIANGLQTLRESRESIEIQGLSVKLAERRVDSARRFLEAGRQQIRDLLEAQNALVGAQNDLTTALVNYRVGELSLQRDLGILEVNESGIWTEYQPPAEEPSE